MVPNNTVTKHVEESESTGILNSKNKGAEKKYAFGQSPYKQPENTEKGDIPFDTDTSKQMSSNTSTEIVAAAADNA